MVTDKEKRILICLKEKITSEGWVFRLECESIFKEALGEKFDLEYAKKLLPLMAANYTDLFPEDNTIFFDAAIAGKLDICIWLLSLPPKYEINPFAVEKEWEKIFELRGHEDLIMWLLSKCMDYVINPVPIYTYASIKAMESGNFVICSHIRKKYKVSPFETERECAILFYGVLRKGDLETCVKVFSIISPETKLTRSLTNAVNHLYICRWLLSLPERYDVRNDPSVLKTVVEKGDLKVCKWLKMLPPGIYNKTTDNIVAAAIISKHLDIYEYLTGKEVIYSEIYPWIFEKVYEKDSERLFESAIEYNNLHILEWLFDNGKGDFIKDDIFFGAFTDAVFCGNKKVADYLWEFGANYISEKKQVEFLSYIIDSEDKAAFNRFIDYIEPSVWLSDTLKYIMPYIPPWESEFEIYCLD